MSPFSAEFIGTMLLIVFAGGVVAGVVLKGTKLEGSGLMVISLAWGIGGAIAVYVVGDASGGHLNPAFTIGLAKIGIFPWANGLGYVLAQFSGAFVGAILVFFHYYPHWKNTEDQGAKLAAFSTAPAFRHTPQNFFNQAFGAFGSFVLVFGILAIGANDLASGLNPILLGILIIVIGLSLGGTTGYAINPARDLAPRIAHAIFGKGSSDWKYAWIPLVGPIIGGALIYESLFNGEIHVALFISIIMLSIYQIRSQKDIGLEVIESDSNLKKSVI